MTSTEIDERLRTRYDALNRAILLAEAKFKAMKPPHDVWAPTVDDLPKERDVTMIGVAKVDGPWRLAFGVMFADGKPSRITPLVDQPVARRVAVCTSGNLRRLHEAIVKAREEFVPEVEAAIRTVEEFLRENK